MQNSITTYLCSTVKRFPDNTALIDKEGSLNYREYDRLSGLVAIYLITKGFNKMPIAVMTEKSKYAVVLFIGIARSRNYYTVIDSKMPDERICKILNTFSPKMIICDKKNYDKAMSVAQSAQVICCDQIFECDYDECKQECIIARERTIIDTDVLYVLFTSGSTGIPKGVIIPHRAAIDYIEWAAETFGFDNENIWGNQAPFYFDNSVLDIYSSLRGGGTMHIIPHTCFSFPIRLLEYIRDNRINTVFWVPTVLSRVANMDILDRCDVSCLEKILFAGEVMPTKQLNIWRRRLPDATFANLYGPTEIAVDCTYYICDRELDDDEPVPIGVPCKNTDIIVLNEQNELVKPGEKGELCVRGTSLSLGYYNAPDKTAEVFVQNPLHNLYEEKIYRTGDIVHYNDKLEIIYDGRKDNQIKHSGHRIELGEIETAASALDGILMVACIHNADEDKLILFYTGDCDEEYIRKTMSSSVPEYMLPNECRKIEQMPINMNGKIDRLVLKRMAAEEIRK